MRHFFAILVVFVLLTSCKKEKERIPGNGTPFKTTPYILDLPNGFPPMPIPKDNPLTVEGVELGKHLFFEKLLSGDNTLSCSGCHTNETGFTDSRQFSIGIDGVAGNRNSMVIQNIAWSPTFFWDGSANSLEKQVFEPVTNPIEMHETWPNAVNKLMNNPKYPKMFYKAFGTTKIDSTHVAKALAQFMRTLISGNSKFDKFRRGEITLTPEELEGFNLFMALDGADCFHCHPNNAFFTDFGFHNNGLDLIPQDNGRAIVTGASTDIGKFKAPTLRNLEFSAPYMHDGRFATLDELIDFYSEGVHHDSPNISPLMEFSFQGGVALNSSEKTALKAFLLTLSDPDFINNPNFKDPNK
jgi:cytochrome c peroxidase